MRSVIVATASSLYLKESLERLRRRCNLSPRQCSRVALRQILALLPTRHRQCGDHDVSDIWAELLRLDGCFEGSRWQSIQFVGLKTSLDPFALWNLRNLVFALLCLRGRCCCCDVFRPLTNSTPFSFFSIPLSTFCSRAASLPYYVLQYKQ